jgi:hypothetical protein
MLATGAPSDARRSDGGFEVRKMRQTIWDDIRDGGRILAKYPGYAALSLLVTFTLCLATYAAFTLLMKTAHRKNLAMLDSEQFMVIADRDTDAPAGLSFSHPMHLALRERNGLATAGASRCKLGMDLANRGGGERVRVEFVSGNYFEVLGARPFLGRLISEADDEESITLPIAVISYDLWKRRFGMDPSIINRSLTLDGHRFAVIGVTSPGFTGMDRFNRADIRVPLSTMGAFAPPILYAKRVDPGESRATNRRL